VVGCIATARGGAATRILEIGGGTGATTHYVLEALQSAGQVPDDYLFTDISPLLVRQAEQNFRDKAFLRTKIFNLERDGISQGVEGPFSIILAANVLHATTDLSATLDRLKSLLAPDGALVLVEVTGKQRWADITVGLLDGWWNFADHQVRPDYPSLENGAWRALLEKSGFGRVITIPESADQRSIFGRQELIIADRLTQHRRVAVVGDRELVDKLALHLRQRQVDVRTTTAENLTQCLQSCDTLDALLWVSEQTENFDRDSSGLASNSAENSVRSLLATTQALLKRRSQSPVRLYIVTSGACAVVYRETQIQLTATPLVGLAAAIGTETPELRCTRFDCSNPETESNAADVAAEVLSNVSDQWVAWRAGKRYVARLRRLSASSAEHDAAGRVQLKTEGGIESLEYIPSTRRELQPDEVEISVHATALNFRDVLQSLGVINLDAPIGTDCAGVILRTGGAVTDLAPGDEVVAIAAGCFASHAIAPRELIIRKPEKLSFAEAAAQSVAYLTADYCLNEIGRVRSRERVLIHAAAGGVGLAALHLCQRAGAEVIATAGSDKKRAFLRSLGVEHVYDSRSLDFAQQISGKVDIVLNSLAAGAVDAGMELLKSDGRFIELGKTDLRDPALVAKKWPGVQYLPVDLTPLFTARSPWVAERLSTILHEVAAGLLPLLPTSVFESAEVREAFRYMARAEHIGRIVVQRKNANRFNGTHLITGGMRGIGLRLAEWLSENGARELVLLGRHAPQAAAGEAIARLRAKGVSVKVLQGDIAVPEVAARAVQLAGTNLRGVWHSAGVLDNAHIEEQSWERMHTVFRPKVDGAWNLHTLTLGMRLDYFVLFSSWASIGGSYGQANHCAANAFLDGLAHFRRAQGLPALSVNWGAWGETGAASGDEVGRQLARSGMRNMPPAGALEALRLALGSNHIQVAIGAIDWPRYLRQRHCDLHSSFYTDFLAGHEAGHERQKSKDSRTASDHTELRVLSAGSTTLEAILALPAAMREADLFRTCGDLVRKTLDLHSDEEIDPDVPLGDLGMDSLLAIELRNGLSGVLSRQFPSTILFDYPTLRTLVRYLEQELLSVNQVTPAIAPASAVIVAADTKVNSLDILDTIEQMSDDEVESWFQ
jgi:NADPH:quinone reductase-like Zn-dependent oxidoreductase/SAM-dependent methyltransferase/acyl carrier protein